MALFRAATSPLAERYELLEKLGEGGFGVVHKARQKTTGQLVAVKTLLLGEGHSGKIRTEQRHRFEREMRLIGQLSSPHVVRLLDAGFDGDDPFMVLEFIRGVELAQLIDRGKMDHGLVTLVADHALRALAEAHERGIVHRDLKPENIMLIGSGLRTSAKVLDFGIAGVHGHGKDKVKDITQWGQFRGTPAYMAPEQFEDFSNARPETDIYALGIILLECLTGKPVYSAPTPFAMFRKHASEPLPMPTWLAGTPMGDLIARASEKEPRLRFGSADIMLEALHRARQNEPRDMACTFDADNFESTVVTGTLGPSVLRALRGLEDRAAEGNDALDSPRDRTLDELEGDDGPDDITRVEGHALPLGFVATLGYGDDDQDDHVDDDYTRIDQVGQVGHAWKKGESSAAEDTDKHEPTHTPSATDDLFGPLDPHDLAIPRDHEDLEDRTEVTNPSHLPRFDRQSLLKRSDELDEDDTHPVDGEALALARKKSHQNRPQDPHQDAILSVGEDLAFTEESDEFSIAHLMGHVPASSPRPARSQTIMERLDEATVGGFPLKVAIALVTVVLVILAVTVFLLAGGDDVSEGSPPQGETVQAEEGASEEHPSDYNNLLLAGVQANTLGAYAEALSAFQTVLASDPANYAAHDGAGWAYIGLAEYQKAQVHFSMSKQSPVYVGSATFGVAKAHHGLGEREEAMQLCREYLSKFATGPRAHEAKALLSEIEAETPTE